MTVDIDTIIEASDAMNDAINRVGDRYGQTVGWLNTGFRKTASYNDKLYEHSEYLFTRSNVLEIRTIRTKYLIAMELVSGWRYKKHLSDIVGRLYDQQKLYKLLWN